VRMWIGFVSVQNPVVVFINGWNFVTKSATVSFWRRAFSYVLTEINVKQKVQKVKTYWVLIYFKAETMKYFHIKLFCEWNLLKNSFIIYQQLVVCCEKSKIWLIDTVNIIRRLYYIPRKYFIHMLLLLTVGYYA
jgi:hypothetical protein